MKRLLIILPVIFLMMACEDNKQNEDDINPLIGAWELTTLSVSMGNLTVDVPIGDDNNETIVIYEDGSFNNQGVLDGESFSGNGTWSSTTTTLTLIEEGETGFLIPVGDYKRLADRIITIIDRNCVVIEMRLKARENVSKKFNKSIMCNRYEKLFRHIKSR